MAVGAPCDVEEEELSPAPAAAQAAAAAPPPVPVAAKAPSITASAAIEASEAADDFFEAVSAHRQEQDQRYANGNTPRLSSIPLSGVQTPEARGGDEGLQRRTEESSGAFSQPSDRLLSSAGHPRAPPTAPSSNRPSQGAPSRGSLRISSTDPAIHKAQDEGHEGPKAGSSSRMVSASNPLEEPPCGGKRGAPCAPPHSSRRSEGALLLEASAAEAESSPLEPPQTERRATTGALQDTFRSRGAPGSARSLLSPAGSIVGMLQRQPQQQQLRRQSEPKRAFLPLNLQRAHDQRMQTIDIQRGTEDPDGPIAVAPDEDLLDQLHKLSTKIQAQEDEKRVMAEESFQLEQILKRQYHTDIRQKSEQNRQLALDNQTLRQQLEKLSSECEGLRGAVALAEEVMSSFFQRLMRPRLALPASHREEDPILSASSDSALEARLNALFTALRNALAAEQDSLDLSTQQELQQRLEGAAALCRATSAAAAAAAAIVSPRPPESLHGDDEAGRMPAAGTTAAAAGLAFLQQEKRLPPLPLVDVETPLPSSEAQLESLKRQIERLRENLGAFTEGLLQAHERHLQAQRPAGVAAKTEGLVERVEALKYVDVSPVKKAFSKSPAAKEPQLTLPPERDLAGVSPVAAVGGPKGPAAYMGAPATSAVGKTKTLWGAATKREDRGAPVLQLPPHAERIRGAVLRPAVPQLRQQQHSSPCNAEGGWGSCLPSNSGGPFESCCEKPPRTGVVLPPLKQRQQQSSRGPCSRQRGPSRGRPPLVGPPGGLPVSASAASLLPALKPAPAAAVAVAAASRASRGGLMGSASAVDLSVVGRPLGPPRGAPTHATSLYTGPNYGHYPIPVGGLQGGPVLGPLPLPRRVQQNAVLPADANRKQWAASSRSKSSSGSGRVFSRTRRSCSPIKERWGEDASSKGPSGGDPPSELPGAALAIESKVSPTAADARGGGPHGARLRNPLLVREEWGPGGPQRAMELGGPRGPPCPLLGGPALYAVTPPRELSPAAMPPADWSRGGASLYPDSMGEYPGTSAALGAVVNQDAALAARLVSPPSSNFVHSYSQPPRRASPMEAVAHLSQALLQQQQQQQQAFIMSLKSPATAAATGSNVGILRSPLNAYTPVNCRCITPSSVRPPPLASVAVGRGGALGAPSPGGGRNAGGPWGACGLLSPLCYSNPPHKSPNSSRSSSNIHNIPRQKEDVGEWSQPRP